MKITDVVTYSAVNVMQILVNACRLLSPLSFLKKRDNRSSYFKNVYKYTGLTVYEVFTIEI